MITGMSAPNTQKIWNRVSKAANDRPWLAPAASRCTMESKESLPALAVIPTPRASKSVEPNPPPQAASRPTKNRATSAVAMITSSRIRSRNLGANSDPTTNPLTVTAATIPSFQAGLASEATSPWKAWRTPAPNAFPHPREVHVVGAAP